MTVKPKTPKASKRKPCHNCLELADERKSLRSRNADLIRRFEAAEAECYEVRQLLVDTDGQRLIAEADKRILQQRLEGKQCLADEVHRLSLQLDSLRAERDTLKEECRAKFERSKLLESEVEDRKVERDALAQKVQERESQLSFAKRQYAATVVDRNEIRAGVAETVASMKREFAPIKPWYRRGFDFVLARFGL